MSESLPAVHSQPAGCGDAQTRALWEENKRLREQLALHYKCGDCGGYVIDYLCPLCLMKERDELANENERLRKSNKRLREKLEYIAQIHAALNSENDAPAV